MEKSWLDELREFIAIPSVSADPAHQDDVRRAAEWVRDFVKRAGGEAELVPQGPRDLVIGDIPASTNGKGAPTVMIYGHFDVQPPAPLELWESAPFELEERDGWFYALIFDGGMTRPEQPEFALATRGLVGYHVRVRTGERDMHSGYYGGAALNAIHVLIRGLSTLLARDGLLPDQLRVGRTALSDVEIASLKKLPSGAEILMEAGATPLDPKAAEQFYDRTWAEPSLDVNGIFGGKPDLVNTTLIVEAHARFTIRLAPGQDPDTVDSAAERLFRSAVPAEADVTLERENSAPPGVFAPDSPAILLGLDAFERAVGVRPILVRVGGTLPIYPALAEKGIPTIGTGFALRESNVHSPNERLRVEDVDRAVAAATELYKGLAALG